VASLHFKAPLIDRSLAPPLSSPAKKR
jgi:hypothetical protein